MNKVVLVGTSHTIQRDKSRIDFAQYVDSLVRKHGVKAIAEEIDVDSIAANSASELNLDYLLIEPTSQERAILEIPSLNEIENTIFMEFDDVDSEEAKTECSIRKEKTYRAREQEWLKRIGTLEHFPVLTICGANHFQPFGDLLRQNCFEVIEESSLWE